MTQDIEGIGIPHQERASTGIAGEGVLSGVTSYRGTIPLLGESRGAAHS